MKNPFFGGDVTHQILNIKPTGIEDQRAGLGIHADPVPRVWEEAILACLGKEVGGRPASALEFAERVGIRGIPSHSEPRDKGKPISNHENERNPASALYYPKPGESWEHGPSGNRSGEKVSSVDYPGPGASRIRGSGGGKQSKEALLGWVAAAIASAAIALFFLRPAPEPSSVPEAAAVEARKSSTPADENDEKASQATAQKKAEQQQQFDAVMARIETLTDSAPQALEANISGEVSQYLAAAPEPWHEKVEVTWKAKQARWLTAQDDAHRRIDTLVDSFVDGSSATLRDAILQNVNAFVSSSSEADGDEAGERWSRRLAGWNAALKAGKVAAAQAASEDSTRAGIVQMINGLSENSSKEQVQNVSDAGYAYLASAPARFHDDVFARLTKGLNEARDRELARAKLSFSQSNGVTNASGASAAPTGNNVDQTPEVIFQIRPTYPPEMKRFGIAGEVVVDFIVDENGDTRNPFAVHSSRPEFDASAVECVQKWKFRPGLKDGRLVFTHMQVPIIFNLDSAK